MGPGPSVITPQEACHAFLGAIYKEGTAKGVSTTRPRTCGLGPSRKPHVRTPPQSMLSYTPYLQGFRYTNDREKLTEARIEAS